MNAQQLDTCFGSGFSRIKAIQLAYQTLSVPEAPITNVQADVQEQQHVINAAFNASTGTLSLQKDPTGDGLWIPWLGQGSASSGQRGWGTYTRAVTNKSWVATGPFSGCYAVAFSEGPRFAHIVTAGGGYSTASVDGQIAAIKAATGATTETKIDMTGAALGIVFFMKINSQWVYRRAFVLPGAGTVAQLGATSVKAF